MPPSSASSSARGGRGIARGGPPKRGRGTPIALGDNSLSADAPQIGGHVVTIGTRRPGFGNAGKPIPIFVNAYKTTTPDKIIYHYDMIGGASKELPARVNMKIIDALQTQVAPGVFTPRAVYDGRKNLFSIRQLFPDGSQQFDVPLGDSNSSRAPKVYKVTLTEVATINPELLHRFVQGQQSPDNAVATAIMALNVVIRMEPSLKYPFNVRSFYTDRETKAIGSGLVLWRGYFQSLRPALGQTLINVDISSGMMYKPGSLISLILEYIGKPPNDPMVLAPSRGLPRHIALKIQRFISGIRITANAVGGGADSSRPRTVKRLSAAGASEMTFETQEGGKMSVAQYFKTAHGRPLKFPEILCVEIGTGALIPLELCDVIPGQIMRKQIPPERTRDVLDFATMAPEDRLRSIKNGFSVLNYGQSEYVRHFGMNVDQGGPVKVAARVLQAPTLKYGAKSKNPRVVPKNGAWNMVEKQFFQAVTIKAIGVMVFEQERRCNRQTVDSVITGLFTGCKEVGIAVHDAKPVVRYGNPQQSVADSLRALGAEIMKVKRMPPDLLVVILPEGGNDIYTAVKHFGDITVGVATQCLKANKCNRAKPQYFANVCLKLNVKLGGINTIPDNQSAPILTDPSNPTCVMGADVIHPAPGSEGKPSFSALVGNVDSNTAKYVAQCRAQESREEMISDLKDMAMHVLDKYMKYHQFAEKKSAESSKPTRIIVYRDGVSEGQFPQVLEHELPRIKEACAELGINAKITMIVVGKRHHIRMFPQFRNDAGDRLGNVPAGTVIDREIVHPTDHDFYLQSHGGLLGTSRPAHYSILHDENNFSADILQSLSFALCHVYARSTRSVSIPAPVYYADIVCSRAKNHYDPSSSLNLEQSDAASTTTGPGHGSSLAEFRAGFKPVHHRQESLMYFS